MALKWSKETSEHREEIYLKNWKFEQLFSDDWLWRNKTSHQWGLRYEHFRISKLLITLKYAFKSLQGCRINYFSWVTREMWSTQAERVQRGSEGKPDHLVHWSLAPLSIARLLPRISCTSWFLAVLFLAIMAALLSSQGAKEPCICVHVWCGWGVRCRSVSVCEHT